MSVQLRLFPLFKPLVERFGQDFFKGAPREPGVYTMRGEEDCILYIGQSKNLRNRLAYYKNANPDRMPRRLVRLVHAVEKITWECSPTAEAARARELELLRLHRPKFNRADTSPEFFHYINAREDAGCIRIQLRFEVPAQPEEQGAWRGPVRGRMIPVQALAALQRLWLGAVRGFRRCSELPIAPRRMTLLELPLGDGAALLKEFLTNGSEALATHLIERQNPESELALRQLQEADAELLLSWARALKEAQP